MSVTGLCQICESAEADHTCDRCGAVVCDSHFDSQRGICSQCLTELPSGQDVPDERNGPGEDDVVGGGEGMH